MTTQNNSYNRKILHYFLVPVRGIMKTGEEIILDMRVW